MEKISEFCHSENIILLEDCAHSYGATLNGKHSGTFGDAGVFSFMQLNLYLQVKVAL